MITWLASYPKSGNTWLRMFLAAYEAGGRVNINAPGSLSYDDLTAYLWQVVSPVPLPELSLQDSLALRSAVLLHMAVARKRVPITVKTHSAFGQYDRYPIIPPSLTDKAIVVVRDPRDVAVSWSHHTQEPIDRIIDWMGDPRWSFGKAPGLWNVVGSWQNNVMSWAKGASEYFPVHVVRYEDMHADPYRTFAKVVEFMGEGWQSHTVPGGFDTQTVRDAIAASRFDALRGQEQETGFKEASERGVPFFRSGRVGAWREALSDDQTRRIEETCAEAMKEMGYDREARQADQVHAEAG